MIVFVCPSKGKSCGIARYTSYVEHFLRRAGIDCVTVPTMAAVLALGKDLLSRIRAVIVQHEYGLFDGDVNRALWAGESTGQLVSRIGKVVRRGIPVVVLMHTVDYLHPRLDRRTRAIAASDATVMTLNPLCAERLGWPFFEHGIPLFVAQGCAAAVDEDEPRLMHFGFLSGMKRADLLFEIAETLRLPLDVNFSTTDRQQIEALQRRVRSSSLPHRVTHGFMDEAAMIARWRGRRGVFVSPQAELNGYYATSGSTRFAMNFGVPIVCTGWLQHLGLDSIDCVPTGDLALQVKLSLAAFEARRAAIAEEAEAKSIGSVYGTLIAGLAA